MRCRGSAARSRDPAVLGTIVAGFPGTKPLAVDRVSRAAPLALRAEPPLALPLLYINLDEDRQRREGMQAQFEARGLVPTRLPAVRWTRLPIDEQRMLHSEALNRDTFFQPLVPGECGCYASHIRAWQALAASDAPALVVLEDDVLLPPDFAETVNAIAALPPGWDMVKLIGRDKEKVRTRQRLTAGHELVSYRRVPSLTAGYVVSREGARKLLAHRVPFGRPVDLDLRFWWECDLVIRGVVPPAIALAPVMAQSSIGQRRASLGLRHAWRKLRFKLGYSLANWRAGAR